MKAQSQPSAYCKDFPVHTGNNFGATVVKKNQVVLREVQFGIHKSRRFKRTVSRYF